MPLLLLVTNLNFHTVLILQVILSLFDYNLQPSQCRANRYQAITHLLSSYLPCNLRYHGLLHHSSTYNFVQATVGHNGLMARQDAGDLSLHIWMIYAQKPPRSI